MCHNMLVWGEMHHALLALSMELWNFVRQDFPVQPNVTAVNGPGKNSPRCSEQNFIPA